MRRRGGRKVGEPTGRRGDPDRFITLRAGNYLYKRRVPRAVEHLDARAPHVRVSLKTRDLALARSKRDMLEAADDALWSSLVGGQNGDPAMARYKAAMRRVEALGGIGVRSIAQLELAAFARVPILFRTEVTNQPAGEGDHALGEGVATQGTDLGARGIAEVGYELVDGLVVRGRGSFQGRTINHAGPGFGGGVGYTW